MVEARFKDGGLIRGWLQAEAQEQLFPRDPGDAHDFRSPPPAGDDLHAGPGDVQRRGEEPDERLVGPVLQGRRGETDADRVPEQPRHPFPRGARQHVDRDHRGLLPPAGFPDGPSAHDILIARSNRVFTRKYCRNRMARIATMGEKSMLPAIRGNLRRSQERTGSALEQMARAMGLYGSGFAQERTARMMRIHM